MNVDHLMFVTYSSFIMKVGSSIQFPKVDIIYGICPTGKPSFLIDNKVIFSRAAIKRNCFVTAFN
jgi:hypothetical protein